MLTTRTPQRSTSLRRFCNWRVRLLEEAPSPLFGLVAEGKTHQQVLVQIRVRALDIVQKLTAAGHHHDQTAAGSVVVLVGDEVLRKVGNALGKHCNLETGGAGVLLVRLEVVDVDIAHFCILC